MRSAFPMKRILVIEDQAPMRRNLALMLEMEGFEVVEAEDGYDGIEQYDRSRPDLIVMDVNMPRLDGKETLKQLRKIEDYNQVPIVLFTTSSSAEDARFAKKFNAGYLTKPMNANQIEFIADKFLNYCSEEVRKNILPG